MAAMSRVDRQRDILIWVIKLRDKINEKQQEELLGRAKEFVQTLGPKAVTDHDLEPGGLQWPAPKKARRAEFLSLVKKLQAGPVVVTSGKLADKGIPPELVVQMTPQKKHIPDEENYQDPNLPFLLGKDVVEYAKTFIADDKAHKKKPGDKKLKEAAADAFVELGSALFDAAYGERDEEEDAAAEEGEQGPDRPRPIIRAALIHADKGITKGQRETFSKIDVQQLEMMLEAVNAEMKRYNPIEDSFGELEAMAEAECEGKCRKHEGTKLSDECNLCHKWLSIKEEVVARQKELDGLKRSSADAKKIKKAKTKLEDAEEVLQEATSAIYGQKIETVKGKFQREMARRLGRLYLGSETALQSFEKEEEEQALLEEKLAKEVATEAKTDEYQSAILGTGLDREMRKYFTKIGRQGHPEWNDMQLSLAVDEIMAARKGEVTAKGKTETAAAKKRFKEAMDVLKGKGGKPAKKRSKPKEAEEEDEDDEEYEPEGDEDEGDDEEEEEEGNDEKAGGTSTTIRRKPPKSYSGAGSFSHPVKMLAPSSRVRPLLPNHLQRQTTSIQRRQPQPMLYQPRMVLPRPYRVGGRCFRRMGGGCGCGGDLFPPKRDEENDTN